jgi:hypothetical protein
MARSPISLNLVLEVGRRSAASVDSIFEYSSLLSRGRDLARPEPGLAMAPLDRCVVLLGVELAGSVT